MNRNRTSLFPILRLCLLILSILCLVLSFLAPLFFLFQGNAGTGIIGGAGAPTYLFYYRSKGFVYLTLLGVLGIVGAVLWIIRRKK
ncbi:MAG: hypothetical protein IJZ37_02915 [Clostridia bacterium]|nr:hypothetical protein [Clostridia bacterium]MBQ8400106.1 hypothetical protein [Clostridia bacterium]